MQSQKWQSDLSSFPKQAIQRHSNPSLCPNYQSWRSRTVLWWHIRPSRTNTKNRCPFHHRGLECKSRKSVTGLPGVTVKFGLWVQIEAGQSLTEFCQENVLNIANTLFQQHKRQLYTWTSPDGQCRNQIDYILCSRRGRSPIQSAETRPGADCGSDHELLTANFRLKLKNH